jgi:hypothetical protein
MLIDAWPLDARFQPSGEPLHWVVPIPARGRQTILLGTQEQGITDHPLPGVRMVSQDPVQVITDAAGICEVIVPAFETLLFKDDTHVFRLDARCQEEETFSALEAGPSAAHSVPRGSTVRLRLPGMNEVRLRYRRMDEVDAWEACHGIA